MQDIQPGYENKISFGGAIKNTTGGISHFIAGLFHLNAKSAAIVGSGVVLGVLSGIPVIGWGYFLFAFVLGAFAVSLYINHAAQPAQYTDGLVIGAITGVFGSFIQLIITLVLAGLYLIYSGLSSAAASRPQNPWMDQSSAFGMLSAFGTFGYMMMASLLLFVPIILLAMLGGLLGVVWFESRVSNSSRVSFQLEQG
jgi:hypothetical protein